MADKIQKIKDWISKEQDGLMDAQGNFEFPEHEGAYHILCNLDAYIHSLQKEPVSECLEEASKNYALNNTPWDDCKDEIQESFKAGAKWQKERLWKPADGDNLPEYEQEVVVLIQPYPLENSEYAVSFAHRPNPNGWDGKSISTGKVEHYTPKTYGKGGWNIPDVKYWLDYDINELLCREKCY